MAAVSAWAKPGSWALASEEHDESEKTQQLPPFAAAAAAANADESADFPSLAAAAVAKVPKKKKAQTLSLAEFNSAPLRPSRLPPPSKVGLTSDELLALPTGPRERSAEELERSSYRGFGLSYGSRRGDDSGPRRGSERGSDEPRRSGFGGEPGREQGPSRADEVENWGAGKKTAVPESRERRSERGFFDSQSRADESDSWISNKGTTRSDSFDGHRERRMGFDRNGSSGGGGADAEFWGNKKVEEPSNGGAGRRRLVLQPRSLPLENTDAGNVNQTEQQAMEEENKKSKSSNPFGNARPREEVLAEKGHDWKKIDEKLENMKIKEATSSPEKAPLIKRAGTGMGSSPEDRTERAWRKPAASEAPPPRVESVEEDYRSSN